MKSNVQRKVRDTGPVTKQKFHAYKTNAQIPSNVSVPRTLDTIPFGRHNRKGDQLTNLNPVWTIVPYALPCLPSRTFLIGVPVDVSYAYRQGASPMTKRRRSHNLSDVWLGRPTSVHLLECPIGFIDDLGVEAAEEWLTFVRFNELRHPGELDIKGGDDQIPVFS